jgi:hypothetical protein
VAATKTFRLENCVPVSLRKGDAAEAVIIVRAKSSQALSTSVLRGLVLRNKSYS